MGEPNREENKEYECERCGFIGFVHDFNKSPIVNLCNDCGKKLKFDLRPKTN